MRLLILDGNSILNRAFYGIKLLSTKDGQYTNAIVGFLNILMKLRDATQPDGIVAAFDVRAKTFRHEMYDAYKAGRKGMPDELASQLPLIKELLRNMGCHIAEKPGYEADDILGTLAAAVREQGGECYIATGDRDSLQLVSDNVTVLLAGTKMGQPETTMMDCAAVQEKYGLTPPQLIDLKALMGDSSDNIPGVAGIGEKTALELMHRFGSLDQLYQEAETADLRESVRAKLLAGKESALLSRRLGTICCAVPMDTDIEHYRQGAVEEELLAKNMARLELFKLLERMLPTLAVSAQTVELSEKEEAAFPVTEATEEQVAEWLSLAEKNGVLDVLPAENGVKVINYTQEASVSANSPLWKTVCKLMETEAVGKRTHDVKRLHHLMAEAGYTLHGCVMDTLLAAYLLNPLASGYDLSRLMQEYQAESFAMLADVLRRETDANGMGKLLDEVEIPLAEVLAAMERDGFEADKEGIAAFGRDLAQRMVQTEQTITDLVGYSFNLNSPKQLAKALFEDLGLPAKKKTKSGYSTNAEVLEKLYDTHPVIPLILEYRTLSKLKSTYCDGLLKVIGQDGRIHTSFNQAETRTGRISSAEPNLQNIPVRQELGKELRRFFRAREGWMLCDADYSQIELRVLAAMSGDETMINAFNEGEDIHQITASQVFNLPLNMVTPLLRSRAKAVNFGIIYGIGAHSLAEDIHVSYSEAKQYIEGYLHHYQAVKDYMEDLIAQAKECGYAQTLFGRRRPLPELRASNAIMRGFGERVARNMPIQGTAADIIKIAMIRVYRRLQRENSPARLILQVHDELMVEAPAEQAAVVAEWLKEEMEAAVSLSVTFSADVHIGKTWYDAK